MIHEVFGNTFNIIYDGIYIITVAFTVILIIQQKGDPLKTISWLLVIFLLPVIGIILYFFLGKTSGKKKYFHEKVLLTLNI